MPALLSALVLVMLGPGPVTARAGEQGLLPAFDVVSPAGATVAGSALSSEAHWLLVYVSTSCGSCDRLLAALDRWRPTLPQDRIVVVIGGTHDGARAYATRHANAAGMAWYADAERSAANALRLEHEPAVVAIENGRVAWTVTGVLNDPTAIEPIIRNWTAR